MAALNTNCYYYSFGSNMSTWRISKNCPAESAPAEFVGAARLDHYQLRFSGPDWPSWHGAPATVSGTKDERHVWGVLWRISQQHLKRLDGFGSNMSTWRIDRNRPPESAPAEFVAAARLDHYELKFSGPARTTWHGAPATVSRADQRHVWGVLWKISQEHLRRLDVQEGEGDVYVRLPVSVTTSHGHQHACYTYVFRQDMEDSLPSKRYLDTIIEGAVEHDLPPEYIEYLRGLPHNGYTGEVNPP